MSATVITNGGVTMPRLIYGTAWKKDATTELVVSAVLAGFRGIDTACQPKHYHEPGIGEALRILARDHKIHREDIFIQTKFTSLDGQDPARIPYDEKADLSTQVKQSLAKSFSNLGVSVVDSLVMHGPMRTTQKTLQVWQEFEEFVKDGKVKQIGLSNCYDLRLLRAIYEAAVVKPSVLQNRFYEDTDYDSDVRTFCKQKGIYYQSFWTLTANPHMVQSQAIANICKNRGKTPAQVWFRYLIQRHDIIILTGTKNEEHMKHDLDITNWQLEESEMKLIDDLF